MTLSDLIGKLVVKPTGKKFKSGNIANTVTGIVDHDITHNLAFTFEEDDSIVEVHRTVLLEDYEELRELSIEAKRKKCIVIHTR
jgi:hypothetical protein